MLKHGILNPAINDLLSRIRHTNMIVIADRGFPYWPEIETVDISLVDGIPTIPQLISAIRPNFHIGEVYMAEEFLASNSQTERDAFLLPLEGIEVRYESHEGEFKPRVPRAIGLIRTGDITPYGNLILVSA